MKFIEELLTGDCFTAENRFFIVTTDFKKNNNRLCICLETGSSRWFEANAVVEHINIYRLDKDNNLISFKETQKDDVAKNQDIS